MEQIGRSQPVLAGILTALVGFTSSFAVVLAGLRAVGASPAEAASGLLAVCATQALGMLWLARLHRIPLTLAWSTPGAALLASTGVVHGGWPAAIGAFLVVGALKAQGQTGPTRYDSE
jgi:benzoate membrane transport protein